MVEHHLAHAASAYYPSPFEEATVLTLDRGGDFRCGARWRAAGIAAHARRAVLSDSLGDLYGRVTELLGFEPAPTSTRCSGFRPPATTASPSLFLDIIGRDGDGARLDRSYFTAERFSQGGFSARFFERLGLAPGAAIPEALRPHIAAGLQSAIEAAAIRMAGEGRNLCLAGGLGLNALLVAALERAPVQNVFVQPAAGNAGTALGAVLDTWHSALRQTKRVPLDNAVPRARHSARPKSSRCSKTASCASATC